MKKYLTVAAILGALAFVSVTYFAQATEPVATTTTTIETTAPVVEHTDHADHAEHAVDAVTGVDAVASECEASVAASFEGKTPSDEEKTAALQACVDAKAAEAKTEVTE